MNVCCRAFGSKLNIECPIITSIAICELKRCGVDGVSGDPVHISNIRIGASRQSGQTRQLLTDSARRGITAMIILILNYSSNK